VEHSIMIRTQIIAGTVCLLSLFAAGAAHAEESPTAGHASVAGLLGYGFKDGANLGFGVRGGYTLPMNVYVGGTFVYHLGKSQSTPVGDVKSNIYYFGVEGGYDLALGPVVLRPYIGLGDVAASATFLGTTVSDGKLGIWPGATVLYPIGNAFVGGDARVLTRDGFTTLSIFATGGMQF